MHSSCDPPKFVDQDFSQFDFSRWHLDGLTLDSAAAAFARIADRLFNSEEWRQNFKDTLPELQRQALVAFKDQSSQLKEEQADTTKAFNERIAAAQERSVNFRKSIEVSAAPPVIQPTPDAFHLVARAVSETDQHLGLHGLTVQIIDPRTEGTPLIQSLTDLDGNAILTVPPELAKERDNQDSTVQVLDPSGKPLANLPRGTCIRVGQVETQVIRIADSPATAELKKAAVQARSDREVRAQVLASRPAILRGELEIVLKALDCRLRDNDAIIAKLEAPPPPIGGEPAPPTSGAPSAPTTGAPSAPAGAPSAPTEAGPTPPSAQAGSSQPESEKKESRKGPQKKDTRESKKRGRKG